MINTEMLDRFSLSNIINFKAGHFGVLSLRL